MVISICRKMNGYLLVLAAMGMVLMFPGIKEGAMGKSVDAGGALSEKKIFFGHHSVGDNILDGVRELLADGSYGDLKLVETRDPAVFDAPVFAHGPVGKNRDPYSKIDDFRRTLLDGVGDKADIAFFKFCFVDIKASTDLEAVFTRYTVVIDELQTAFPRLAIVHCTVPVTFLQGGVKAVVKRVLGKPVYGEADNVARGKFNSMLIAKYGTAVFDLARVESTYPDGRRNEFVSGGEKYGYMIGAYTDDGDHLNLTGSKRAGQALLEFLADYSEKEA